MKNQAIAYLHSFANPKKVEESKRFFKTGVGEYGEGDKFLGITVPNIRVAVKRYRFELSLEELSKIIQSKFHEERAFALMVLVCKVRAKRVVKESKEEIFNFYIQHKAFVNNWDLVDVSAPYVMGGYLLDKDRGILYEFAQSDNLWEKRIAIISTFAFINAHQFRDTFAIADILLHDEHDLIHKAVGWAIRNVGIKNFHEEETFLKTRYKNMPRTMLRYAIEKFDEPLRQKYLKGEI